MPMTCDAVPSDIQNTVASFGRSASFTRRERALAKAAAARQAMAPRGRASGSWDVAVMD